MFTAFKGIAAIVPGWVWALICAAALAFGGVEHVRGSLARSEEQSALAQRDAFSTELETTRRKVDANKAQAVKVLAKIINENLDAETRLKTLTDKMEADRGKAQTDLAAVVQRRAATERLSFTAPATEAGGRGRGGGSTEGQAGVATADPAATTTIVLPERVSGRLFARAGDAESLSIDYRLLFDWVNNPKLVCELLP